LDTLPLHCQAIWILDCYILYMFMFIVFVNDVVVNIAAVYRASICYQPDIEKLTSVDELEIGKVCT